jgi:hypothetical protein
LAPELSAHGERNRARGARPRCCVLGGLRLEPELGRVGADVVAPDGDAAAEVVDGVHGAVAHGGREAVRLHGAAGAREARRVDGACSRPHGGAPW